MQKRLEHKWGEQVAALQAENPKADTTGLAYMAAERIGCEVTFDRDGNARLAY